MSRDIFTWCATLHCTRSTTSNMFCSHGVSGIVGLICTGLFAQASVAANDAFTEIDGGWFDQSKLNEMPDVNRLTLSTDWIQLGYQIAWICAGSGWTFVISYILLVIIDHIPVQ